MNGDIPCSWVERLSVKMLILSKFAYRFNAIPIRIPADFLVEIDKVILEFIYRISLLAQQLKDWHCHGCGSGGCCSTGLILVPGASACHRHCKKKKSENPQTPIYH